MSSIIAVVGSRSLPLSWRNRVESVVGSLVSRGHSVGSGGALGADLFALRACVLSGSGACSGSVVFLPGRVESSPLPCHHWLSAFRQLGGQVVPGPARLGARRDEFVPALFARSQSLVRHSQGVVAFISGRSSGSWFTCRFAVSLGLPVVVYPVEGVGGLRSLGFGRWVPLHSWAGSFRWEVDHE